METLTLQTLTESIASDGIGMRARVDLEPLGGPDDKVFPASYGVPQGTESKYAREERRIDGQTVPTVLLNSVAAEANRIEMALIEAHRNGDIQIPVVAIDFESAGLPEFGQLSAYEVSHRIYDAALRDSLIDEGSGPVLFRLSNIGRAVTEATPRNAAALFTYAPGSLLAGAWDSTGPKGGRGSKFERAMTSEIIGANSVSGVKVGSRIDVLSIEKGQKIYESTDTDEGWTLDESKARKDKGKAVLFTRKGGDGKAGDPSNINHGNIPPSIDSQAGGVSIDRALQIAVLSFGALRKFRFPVDASGKPFTPEQRTAVETAARTALAALGIVGLVLAYEGDYDLRSRCVLRPTAPLTFELMRRGVKDSVHLTITLDQARQLLADASAACAKAGLPWLTEETTLVPSERLVTLITKSRELGEVTEAIDAP